MGRRLTPLHHLFGREGLASYLGLVGGVAAHMALFLDGFVEAALVLHIGRDIDGRVGVALPFQGLVALFDLLHWKVDSESKSVDWLLCLIRST